MIKCRFILYLSSNTHFVPDCNKASGITNPKLIAASQITASSAYSADNAPSNARLETIERLMSGWVPADEDQSWIQVNLQQEFTIHAILTQGCQDENFWTTSYAMQYWIKDSQVMVYYKDDPKLDRKVSAGGCEADVSVMY